MKQLILSLMVMLMSMMASTPCSAKTEFETSKNAYDCSVVSNGSKSNLKNLLGMVPKNIVVKQTTLFNDGRALIIYYKKRGMNVEVYSPCNADDYNMDDASQIQSTNFEVVNNVEGKLYRKATVGELTRLIKNLVI